MVVMNIIIIIIIYGLMTDLAHTNLYQWRVLLWSRNSYVMKLLCLCWSLIHRHDWVFPFSVWLHTFSTTMCISWEYVDKKKPKWFIWCSEHHCSKVICAHFVLWAHVEFWHSSLIHQSYGNVVQELKKLNNPYVAKKWTDARQGN